MVARDADKLLPLPTGKKILVVEQKVKEYNDMQWHSGILYEACMRQSRHVDYQETAYSYDDADKTAIMARARDYDLLVITSYFLRGKLSNREWLEGFLADCKTPAVIVTNRRSASRKMRAMSSSRLPPRPPTSRRRLRCCSANARPKERCQ